MKHEVRHGREKRADFDLERLRPSGVRMVFGSEDSKPLDDRFPRFCITKERDRPKPQGFGKAIEGFADKS
jgi:hypothetical protein